MHELIFFLVVNDFLNLNFSYSQYSNCILILNLTNSLKHNKNYIKNDSVN
jgi:hypothetical protein